MHSMSGRKGEAAWRSGASPFSTTRWRGGPATRQEPRERCGRVAVFSSCRRRLLNMPNISMPVYSREIQRDQFVRRVYRADRAPPGGGVGDCDWAASGCRLLWLAQICMASIVIYLLGLHDRALVAIASGWTL